MAEYTGIIATNGTNVLSQRDIEILRERNSPLSDGKIFIAQAGPQEHGLAANVDFLVTGGNRGGGKANTYSTPVITPRGTVKMGDLKIGDEVCTPFEGIQKVTAIYEQGEQQAYTLHFDDGSTVSATEEHRFWAKSPTDNEYKVYTIKDLLKHYKVGQMGMFAIREGHEGHYEIPLCRPIDFNNGITMEDLPIHPQMLGMIMSKGTVWFSETGAALPSYWSAMSPLIYNLGYLTKLKNSGKQTKCFVTGIPDQERIKITRWRTPVPAVIPDIYMKADIESRIAFIQGVLYFNRYHFAGHTYQNRVNNLKGHPYLCMTNGPFIQQLADMCRSLGWWAGVSTETDPMTGEKTWRLVIIAPDDNIPCMYLPANAKGRGHLKVAEIPKNKDDMGGLKKQIMRISSYGKTQCRCITVSGKDHLYLTDGYTINHNTFTLLMSTLYDIDNSRFNSIIFRKERDDLANIIRDSEALYKGEGAYNRSKDDMTWYFNSGATLKLTYYDGAYEDFLARFQGRQYAYIGIDEITQMPYQKFKYLITTNRNAVKIRNRIIGTCNPDPLSWVRTFIGWWIGEDGYPIKERDGKVRYCYMGGDDVTQVVWGDSREEVYEQKKEEIDRLWAQTWGNDLPPAGYTPEKMFTKSVTFIRAELKYNRILTDNDPSYFANLAQQSDEQKARDLMGNWNFMETSNNLIKVTDMIACFKNAHQTGNGERWASCDVAFTGGDQCVLWLWIGWHVQDVCVCKKDSKTTVSIISAKLEEWHVKESHFTYDLNGLGQILKGFFPKARPFNNLEAVKPKYKGMYDTVKSQCAFLFADKIINREISFNPSILDRRFSGKGYKNRPLRDILLDEMKCIKKDESKSDKGDCLITKSQMKTLIGHSPDFMEGLFMRYTFELKRSEMEIPSWAYNF